MLAGEPETCLRALEAHYPLFAHVGFAGNAHRFAIACVRIASTRGLDLRGVAEAGPLSTRIRSFAERAGAKWWITVLEEAGL